MIPFLPLFLSTALLGEPHFGDQPADTHLIPEARQVLSYFGKIYGKEVLYGQATNTGLGIGEYPNAVAMEQASGKLPAILSIDLYGWNPPHWGSNYRAVLQAYIHDAKNWWQNRHGVLSMQYHWGYPLKPDGTAWVRDLKNAPKVDLGRLVTNGTPEHEAAMLDLSRTADAMQELADAHVPVLFRPLHEIDGGWFWWTDRAKPENTAALYRMIYNYLVGSRKFHNLIWVYSAGDQRDPVEMRRRFYPGSSYVDIAGIDIYSDQVGQDYHTNAYKNYYDLMAQVAPGKMLALCECNAVPNPDVMTKTGPKWLYCLTWWAPGKDNPAEWVKRVANDPLIVTLDKLPKWDAATYGLTIGWDKTTVISKSSPTLQVVVNPPLRHGEPLSIASYKAVKELGADYVRYVPWLPYPRLAVAELEPPTPQKTSWDFSLIDPMTTDFLAATKGHPTVMNFSTIPQWLFKTDKPVTYPTDSNQPFWSYTQGTELRDATGKALGDYYGRLVSWYVNGGFTDENGLHHRSGYHYKFPVWEVLNEVESEHATNAKDYTDRYDAIVEGIRRASPKTQFMGMALAAPKDHLAFVEYFLNPANHKLGIPLDYISYHFYATPSREQKVDDWQHTFFEQADGFLNTVRSIEAIRKRLSPKTKTDLDELGVILPTDNTATDKIPPPTIYWNAAGSLYAYLYIQLSRLQIDIIGESQLVGYPSQYPSVSLMDWTKNKPNARFWVLKLIKDNFHPCDSLVETTIEGAGAGDLEAQAFLTSSGHKLLLVNKRDQAIEVSLPDAQKAKALAVDETTEDEPARKVKLTGGKIALEPFAVTVVSWAR